MLIEFFVFGTIWFWLLSIVAFIAITAFVESAVDRDDDSGGGTWATSTIVLFILIYFFLGSDTDVRNILSWIKVNPTTFFFYILGYYAVGTIWSIAKWFLFLRKKVRMAEKHLESTSSVSRLNDFDFRAPLAADNKSRIISWMSYWPFSAFWTILNKFFLRVWEFLYETFEKLYNNMAKRAFSDLNEKIAAKRKSLDK